MKTKILLFLISLLTVSITMAQVNITFELNTETIKNEIDPSGIFLAGGSGFGVAGDNPMLDPDGDGIYSITVQRPAGFESHYTFLNGNCPEWNCKENLLGLPCADPANFNDRFLQVGDSDSTILACFGTCDNDGTCTIVTDSISITFELNTESIDTVASTGIFLAGGGNFGVAGDNPMADPDGDGIYTITVRRPVGFSSFYTFLNGNCPEWDCKEDLAGLSCADPGNFNDRFLPATTTDITIKACYGNCADDGTCEGNVAVMDSINITFELNTASIDTIDPSGLFLAGGAGFGVAGDNPMTDSDGDGIYTLTVRKPEGFSSHYTFLNGNCPEWDCKEDLAGLSCADPGNFNDRFLPEAMADLTIKACFGTCDDDGSCDMVIIGINDLETDQNLFTVQPTIVKHFTNINFGENFIHQEKQILLISSSGQIVYAANLMHENSYRINTSNYTNGLYSLSVITDASKFTKKLIILK